MKRKDWQIKEVLIDSLNGRLVWEFYAINKIACICIVKLRDFTTASTLAITHRMTLSGEYLFPSTRADAKSEYRNRTFFEKRLREWCKQIGIERITPHQLRHYFATYTLSRGGDIKAVSEMLGHADVGITLKIYHHVNAKSIQQMHREYGPLRKQEAVGALA